MQKSFLIVLAALLVVSVSAQTYPIATNISYFTQWLPVVVLAVMLSIGIVVGYYLLGMLLNNSQMRSGAINEFSNVIFTIVIVVIILAIFNFIGNATYATAVIPRSVPQSICNTLQNANLNFISTSTQYNSPAEQICASLINNNAGAGLTPNIDYPLASTYLIIANLTNQSVTNLNAVYVFGSYINFLGSFVATDSICVPNETCLLGTFGSEAVGFTAIVSFSPFAGETSVAYTMRAFTTQSTLIFTSFMLQLIGIIVMLFMWPYLLAAGIILRSTFLTRRLGGLLIAICIGGLLVFPLVFLAQYAGLTNANLVPIGSNTFNSMNSNAIPILAINGLDNNGNLVVYNSNSINFYVFPRADYAIHAAGCWPHVDLLTQELAIVTTYIAPGYGLAVGLSNLAGSLGSFTTTALLPTSCNTAASINSLYALANIYGIMSIIGIFFPLMDLLIGISAIIGISDLIGGSTSLIGLERLL